MKQQHLEGIILQGLNFRDYDKILTVFTPDEGVVKFIAKGVRRGSKTGKGNTDPLSQCEFVYSIGKSDLWRCDDISILEAYLPLREDFERIQAACACGRAILQSQLTHKPAPALYALLKSYLKGLCTAPEPENVVVSFLLKVLRHEGLFAITPDCGVCQKKLERWCLSEGQSFCPTHAPHDALEIGTEEAQAVQRLAFCRTFTELSTIPVIPGLQDKISPLFGSTVLP